MCTLFFGGGGLMCTCTPPVLHLLAHQHKAATAGEVGGWQAVGPLILHLEKNPADMVRLGSH